MGLLDFLFPKYCVNCQKLGSYLCADCFSYLSFDTDKICLICNRPSIDGLTHPGCRGRYTIDGAFTAIAYKGVVKKLIYQFKYQPHLADLQRTLVSLFYESLIQNETFYRAYENSLAGTSVLVPIPLHPSKLKTRGYNQAEILAHGLSKKLDLPMKSLLKRIKQTHTQVGLKQEERRENIRGAFSLSPIPYPAKRDPASQGLYHHIFLVDDILTTGSTLLEAARVLKRTGVKRVWGLALAKD